jgi:transposase InsO family protein
MSALCREFGISRKTGYKFAERYRGWGQDGLDDKSRRPKSCPDATPEERVKLVLDARARYPTWGPRKLRAWLEREHPGVELPSRTTIANVLRRHQLTKPQRRRRHVAPYTQPLSHAKAPNDLWCIDFKGQFALGDGTLCYPLTVTDAFSRYLLLCEAFDGIRSDQVLKALDALFRDKGLPRAIRSDNGEPFVSPRGLFGLSRLGVWLERLGIVHERIDPGCPQQNGRHERMHRTLKAETTRPAARTLLGQQERLDTWRTCFNDERPHQALADRTPASQYLPSSRTFDGNTPLPEYPLHDRTLTVWKGAIVKIDRLRRFALTAALVGERIGVRELEDGRWLVTFVHRDLGHYDDRERRFIPLSIDLPGVDPGNKEINEKEEENKPDETEAAAQ